MSDSTKQQIIKIIVDDSDAKQKTNAHHAAERQQIKQTAAEQRKADKAASDAAKEKARAQKQLDAQAARDAKALAKESLDAEKSAATEKQKVEKTTQAWIVRDYKDRIRQQVREAKRLADEEKRFTAEKKRIFEQFIREQEEGEHRARKAREDGIGSITKMGAAFIGLSSANQVVGAFVDHFDRIRQYATRTAQEIQKMRGDLRELAALRGEMGVSGPTLAHVLEVSSQTLQSPQDVQAMEQEFRGIAELQIGKNVTSADADKALVATGKMAALEGGDAGAYGRLMGQIVMQSDHKISPEEAEARLDRMFNIQQPGGFKNMSQAADQYARVNSLVMNKILSPEQAMTLESMFSVSSPEEAATKTEQFTRATMAGQFRARGMKVAEGIDTQKSRAYLKDIGVTNQNDPIEIGKKIADDLLKKEAEAAAKKEKFNAYSYLGTHGFGQQQDLLSVMDFTGMRNSDNLKKIEDAANAPLDIGAPGKGPISRRFDAWAIDLGMQGRKAEIAEQLADAKRGLAEEPLIIAQRSAFAKLKGQGKVSGSFDEWRNANWFQRTAEDIFLDNKHGQVNDETAHALRAQAKGLGIEDSGWFNDEGSLRALANKVNQAGGSMTNGVSEDMQAAAADIKAAAAEFRAAMNPPKPPPAPPPPPKSIGIPPPQMHNMGRM